MNTNSLIKSITNLDVQDIASAVYIDGELRDDLGQEGSNYYAIVIDELTDFELPREVVASAAMHDCTTPDGTELSEARTTRDFIVGKLKEWVDSRNDRV